MFCSIEDEVPVFGKIMDILVWSMGKCIFVIIPYVGDNFFNHYNAYEVRPDNSNYIFQTPDNLADHRTLSLSTSFSQHLRNKAFVSLKYQVCCKPHC